MKTLMKMVLGACLVHGAALAEVPAPEVKFSFDDDLDAGLHVKFVPVDEAEYARIQAKIELGRYHCHTYVKENR